MSGFVNVSIVHQIVEDFASLVDVYFDECSSLREFEMAGVCGLFDEDLLEVQIRDGNDARRGTKLRTKIPHTHFNKASNISI